MTGNVRGTYSGLVVVEDEGGTGVVPVDALPAMLTDARRRGHAYHWGRSFALADLIDADDHLTRGELAELPPCVECIDGPATTTNLRDQPVCSFHQDDDNPEDD